MVSIKQFWLDRPKEAFESSSMTTQLKAAMNPKVDGPLVINANDQEKAVLFVLVSGGYQSFQLQLLDFFGNFK